jgi:hypothetical protein
MSKGISEKQNPWLDEGSRYEEGRQKKQNIRDMKFLDNTTHTIRILPSKKAEEFPFFGYKQHWIPQNGSITGRPITHDIDGRCPVCLWLSIQWDEIHRLKEEEDMTDKSPEVEAIFNKITKVSAKTRYDMNILHREDSQCRNDETGEEVLASKRMSCGGTIYKEIFSFAKKWGSPSNDEAGYDLEIVTSGSKERREYRVIPDRDASPLTIEERELIEKVYNLKELRKNSTYEEIKIILENARTPYNEIIQYMNSDKTTSTNDNIVEVEKEIEEVVEKENKKEVKKEVKKENKKEVEKPIEVIEKVEVVEKSEDPIDDEHNIEVYECKGDYDENDKMCSDCPVKNDCEEAHPFYVKAKQLNIDTDPHKLIKEIINEVKKQEEQASVPKKRGKIPF